MEAGKMLKQVPGAEHYVHVCPRSNNGAEIGLHDLQPYMVVNGKMVNIKFCPYCGAEIEKEERP
jgi:hypothetical protein